MSDDSKSETIQEMVARMHKEHQIKRKSELKAMHSEGKFVTGEKVKGKAIAQVKKEKKEAWKNRHNDPNYKAFGPGYLSGAKTNPKTIAYIRAKDYNKDYDKMKGDWYETTDKRSKTEPYKPEPY